jgi:queuosine precursor transporter
VVNEYYFLLQVLFVFLLCYGAMRLGKEALITAVSLLSVLANFFVLKQMLFFGFEVTCSDSFAIGSLLALNLLREYYGKEAAKKAIWIAFLSMGAFVCFSHLHLRLSPSPHDQTHLAYSLLLAPSPRLLFASIFTFFIVQKIDLRSFSWISNLLPRSSFSLRTTLTQSFSQFLDTLLFSVLGLYGLMANLTHVILISFLIKICILLVLAPLTTLFRRARV